MAPGAILWLRDLIYAFEPAEVERVMAGWFGAAVDDPAEGYTAQDLATHIRTEFSTFTWLLEPMLAHAGFRLLDTEIDRRRTYARCACVKLGFDLGLVTIWRHRPSTDSVPNIGRGGRRSVAG
jgi:hypothetical protein